MPGGEPRRERTGAWSNWGIRLAVLLCLALAVSLGWAWIGTFYRGVSVNDQLSYKSFDFIAGIPHLRATPIIGHHYFGDFQVPLGYADGLRHSISPYLRPSPEQYPPFTQVLFVPLTFLPLRVAAFIYLSLSAVVFLLPLWLLLRPLEREYRVMLLIPIAVLTLPFLSFLDRGNDVGLVAGLIAWAVWAWKSENGVWCAVFLAAAIALKAYPAALLVVPIALRRYKFTALVAASATALNVLVLVFYPGGFVRNLRAVLPALQGGSTALNQLHSWSLYLVVSKTAGLFGGLLLALALTATLAPLAFIISGVHGFETVLTEYLSPLLILLTLGAAVVYSLLPASAEAALAIPASRGFTRLSTGRRPSPKVH